MKKDVEWAKKKIKEIHTLTFDSYEAAVIANNKHFQMKNSEQLALINRIMEILDRLDEPETLSQKWIDNRTASAYTIAHYSEEDVPVVTVYDLENLLVPKQELPVIPKFVAEWIEASRDAMYTLLGAVYDGVFSEDVKEWLFKGDKRIRQDNQDKLTRAWIDGYEVEEEQKYEVRCKGELLLTYYTNIGEVVSMSRWDNHLSKKAGRDWKLRHELTEQEIKDYDERFWPFAVKVEELEE